MYECIKLPFQNVVIDSMSDEDGSNASYVRLSYNGYFFYFSYHYLRPVNNNFNNIACFMRNKDIYIIGRKISSNSYLICWMGDCNCIEFRMENVEGNRTKSGCFTAFSGAIVLALSFGTYSASDSDTTACYTVFLIMSILGFFLASFFFIETFSSNFIKIRNLMRKNLMQENYLFSPLESIAESSRDEMARELPKELSRVTVTVVSVYRKRRKVTAVFYNTSISTSHEENYTKCMINMVCDGEKYTFEYHESPFSRRITETGIAPFIAKGDKVTLYWYEPNHEAIPRDREKNEYGKRIICLFNETTNNFYESRRSIEPKNVFKVIKSGGDDMYNIFSLY